MYLCYVISQYKVYFYILLWIIGRISGIKFKNLFILLQFVFILKTNRITYFLQSNFTFKKKLV